MACIYLATNRINGRQYVGCTTYTLAFRRHAHEKVAATRPNTYFTRALRKYGPDAFDWEEVYSDVPKEDLPRLEAECVAWYGTKAPGGYNLTDGGEGTSGYVYTDEVRARMKELANRPENIARVKATHTGRKASPETLERMRLVHTGKGHSEKTRKKIGDVQRGRKQNAEWIKNRAKALEGHEVTDTTRAKISKALRSPEGNARLRAAAERNREKRQEALRRWNRWRDWESCAL